MPVVVVDGDVNCRLGALTAAIYGGWFCLYLAINFGHTIRR